MIGVKLMLKNTEEKYSKSSATEEEYSKILDWMPKKVYVMCNVLYFNTINNFI